MPSRRTPKKGSKYYIGHYEFFAMANICLNYDEYEAELLELKEKPDPSEEDRARFDRIARILQGIHQCILECAEGMDDYLFQNVCHAVPTTKLIETGMPMNHAMFSGIRTRFYYRLSRTI